MQFNLRQLRKERGLSRVEAAEIIGISVDHVISLETGRKNPSLRVLEKVYIAFNCSSVDEVLKVC